MSNGHVSTHPCLPRDNCKQDFQTDDQSDVDKNDKNVDTGADDDCHEDRYDSVPNSKDDNKMYLIGSADSRFKRFKQFIRASGVQTVHRVKLAIRPYNSLQLT